jgi:hypothetical protein
MTRTVPREYIDAMNALKAQPLLAGWPDAVLIEIVIIVADIVCAPLLEDEDEDGE